MCLYLPFNTKIRSTMLCTSGFELYSPLSVIPTLELCISFNCCRRINHCTKPENFFELFTLINRLPSVAFLGHFTDKVTDFPTISYTSSGKIPTLSYT